MELGQKIFNGAIWSSLERLSVQVVSFVLGIVLGRILSPQEYGTVAILIVFISFSQVFVDSGFSKALIQRKDRSKIDISTVFTFNVAIGFACYIILWLSAPLIANFFGNTELIDLLRVLALSLIFNALFSTPNTLFSIDLNFKVVAKINLIAMLTSGLIAIYLAWVGWGVWALVIQILLKSMLTMALMWFYSKARPSFKFSKTSFKSLFSFGSKILASSLLNNILSNLNAILIGRFLGAVQLGAYTRGTQNADIMFSMSSTALNNVLLPGLTSVQDDKVKLVRYSKSILRITSIITIPVFLGLAVMAEPIVLLLLTEKWIMAVPIMQIICVARCITVLSGLSINMLYVIGRSDLVLKQEYVKNAIRVVLLLIALPYGIIYIALAELLATIIHFFINTYYPGTLLGYGGIKQIKDIFLVFLAGAIMTAFAYFSSQYIEGDFLKLLIVPLFSALLYWGLIHIFNIREQYQLVEKFKTLLNSKKQ